MGPPPAFARGGPRDRPRRHHGGDALRPDGPLQGGLRLGMLPPKGGDMPISEHGLRDRLEHGADGNTLGTRDHLEHISDLDRNGNTRWQNLLFLGHLNPLPAICGNTTTDHPEPRGPGITTRLPL